MTRVLIVDDKEENLYYLQALLTGHGFAVEAARHGAEALVKARLQPPDLVIADLLMPVMDGYTLLRHWKADARLRQAPFIVYTATYTEEEDERLALSLGADAFILKPAEPEDFLARIREVQDHAAQSPGAPSIPAGDEQGLLKSYSETLIRKLEEKTLQLEETNRELQRDISERLLVEQRLRELNRTYAVLSDIKQLIVRQREAQAIFDGACRIAVEKGKFRMAWIGMLDPSGDAVQPVASSGVVDGDPDVMRIDLRDERRRRGPAASCLLSGERAICNDIEHDPRYLPWRDEVLRRGYRSSGSFPLKVEERVVGVFNLYAGEPGFFGAEELGLLDEMATDIGFALEVSRRAVERQRALEQLRDSEERFRELAETIQEVFWITTPDQRRVLYVSPSYERIWGRSCASLYAAPRSWVGAIHVDDRARIVAAAETKQTRGDYDETFRVVRPDGMVRWIRGRAFPVHGTAGEVVRLVGTAEDITNRRQLEEHMRQAQKMEAIGLLAGGVAHDFNNILAAILGNTQLALADAPAGHAVRHSLEEIRKAGERATMLVQQILAFSSQQPQERRVIALGPILEESVGFLRATIPSVVDLALAVDAEAPPVLADPTQVHQVVANLCTNAWHALEDQPGRIDVALGSVTLDAAATSRLAGLRAGHVACLAVTDTGRGMDAATLERIFDPFFTTKAPGKGTGMGLSVVHGIVQGHDGAITVESLPGRGTTVRVYFPAAAAPVQAVAAPTALPQRGTGQHILYLDDEEPLVSLATRMLERLGYRVSGFTSAADATQAFRADPQQFDLVIADLNMPGASGLHVAGDFLKLRPDLPIVLCSGHVTEDLRQRAHAAGIRDVLYKPNTMEELSGAIHRFASGARQS